MVCGILTYFLAISCTLTYNIWNKRSFCSPSDSILNDMKCFDYQKVLIKKPLLSFLFFEHRYLSFYTSY